MDGDDNMADAGRISGGESGDEADGATGNGDKETAMRTVWTTMAQTAKKSRISQMTS